MSEPDPQTFRMMPFLSRYWHSISIPPRTWFICFFESCCAAKSRIVFIVVVFEGLKFALVRTFASRQLSETAVFRRRLRPVRKKLLIFTMPFCVLVEPLSCHTRFCFLAERLFVVTCWRTPIRLTDGNHPAPPKRVPERR